MKRLLFTLIIISITMNTYADDPDYEKMSSNQTWKTEDLKSKVKSYQQRVYSPIEREGTVTPGTQSFEDINLSNEDKFYDKDGYLIKQIVYSKEADKFVTFNYDYDLDEHRLTITAVMDGQNLSQNFCLLDANRRVIENTFYYNGENLVSKAMLSYDEVGRLLKTDLLLEGTNPYVGYQNIYVDDKQTEKIIFAYQNKYADHSYYEYDSDGNLIRIRTKGFTFEYGRNLDISQKSEEEAVRRTEYHYDKEGRLIREDRYESNMNSTAETVTYRYDTKGNLVEIDDDYSTDDPEVTFRYVFDYDTHGNWIRKVKYENGIPAAVIERKYEYFE